MIHTIYYFLLLHNMQQLVLLISISAMLILRYTALQVKSELSLLFEISIIHFQSNYRLTQGIYNE